jgi:hypothetical protein
VQKLERALAELKQGRQPQVATPTTPEPLKPRESTPLPVTTTKPKTPLKSFGSLDALFRK